jgi:2-methylcitrate dehydratase
LSQAWVDGQSLRTYRHAPNTGSRKSWAAGDATSRAVRLAMMTMAGEAGYPSALTAKTWGFYDVSFRGRPFSMQRPFGSYVMEHVLFKVSFPAEFHAQTAVEAAIRLHPEVRPRISDVEKIVITTHESALRIIDKQGPLHNPADRDHCLQYMTAVGLLKGSLEAEDYEDAAAADPLIDQLRAKMVCVEEPRYSREYLDPSVRSIANAIQVFYADGTSSENVEVEFPVGHRKRRAEAVPLLIEKFRRNVLRRFSGVRADGILARCRNARRLAETPVNEFVDLFVV